MAEEQKNLRQKQKMWALRKPILDTHIFALQEKIQKLELEIDRIVIEKIIYHTCKVITKKSRPKMDGFNYFRYSPRPEGGSLGYSSSSKLSNGPLRPERWSLVYSTFSSTSLSISFLACAEGRAA